MIQEETTFYAFTSNIRYFLSALLRNPLTAEPSEYLKERGFTKQRLIKLLLLKDVITKKERVSIIKNNEKQKAVYNIKYGVKRENFERKLKKIFIQFFEKNLPTRDVISEEGDGGATSASACNNSAPIMPMSSQIIYRPSILHGKAGKKDNNIDPTEINGKTLNEKQRHFYFTEEQINRFKKKVK